MSAECNTWLQAFKVRKKSAINLNKLTGITTLACHLMFLASKKVIQISQISFVNMYVLYTANFASFWIWSYTFCVFIFSLSFGLANAVMWLAIPSVIDTPPMEDSPEVFHRGGVSFKWIGMLGDSMWKSHTLCTTGGSTYGPNQHRPPPLWQINHANAAYFRLFWGYFRVISATRPPFWISAPLFTYPGSTPAVLHVV